MTPNFYYNSRNELRRVKCFFDPSVSQSVRSSVSPVFPFSATPLKSLKQNFVKLCSYEGHNV